MDDGASLTEIGEGIACHYVATLYMCVLYMLLYRKLGIYVASSKIKLMHNYGKGSSPMKNILHKSLSHEVCPYHPLLVMLALANYILCNFCPVHGVF